MLADLVFALSLTQLEPAESQQILQAQIAGECRQLQRLERIYSAADLGSTRLGDLRRGVSVTLAGEVNQPSAGWIRISAPFDGYILATFLAPCGSVANPPQLFIPAPPSIFIRPRLPRPRPQIAPPQPPQSSQPPSSPNTPRSLP